MSKIRKYWLLVVYAAILGAVIGTHELGQNTTQAAGSAPVTVVNTPLPVQGTVNAAQSGTWNVGVLGTPAVSAVQSGAWNVGITGSPGVTVANANSQPVPTLAAGASLVTHMGQLPSNHVVLVAGTGCPSWTRINPDGSLSAFTIPAGDDLMITDTDLSVTGCTPGTFCAVALQVGGNTVLSSFAISDSNSFAASNVHLTSGIVVSVLPTCFPPTPAFVEIRGYLIPAS